MAEVEQDDAVQDDAVEELDATVDDTDDSVDVTASATADADSGDVISEPDHLATPLGDDTEALGGEEIGVVEALQAWSQGGHAEDEFEDGDDIAPVQFAQLDAHPVKSVTGREDRLNNVMVQISVELGRKHMKVNELLNLKEQDCIELDKLAGEAFDILINKRAFAEGEIVVVTDLMAVRITRLRESTARD